MRKILLVVVLLCSAIIWQSCGSKTETSENDSIDSVSDASVETLADDMKSDDVAAKRALIEEARAKKQEERAQALAAKAKESLTYTDETGKVVYNKAEIDPSFTGGDKAMMTYLRDNLQYPKAAEEKGVEGTVFVNFIVDEKGNVRQVVASDVIGDDIDQLLTKEAVRVVTAMPAWVAGRQHGKDVDVNFSIPITFELSN